jgi:hypothetical protein
MFRFLYNKYSELVLTIRCVKIVYTSYLNLMRFLIIVKNLKLNRSSPDSKSQNVESTQNGLNIIENNNILN